MVAAAVSRSVAGAMATDRAATQRQAEKNIKATTQAQRKSDRALVQDQAKAGSGPKSAVALAEHRQGQTRPGEEFSPGDVHALVTSSRGWLADKAPGVKGEAADVAAGATVGGPIWAAMKELGEVAESAKDSLGHFKKSTDKATASTGKSAAVRGQNGRYASQKAQKEERRHSNLLSAIRKIRPGVGGGGGGNGGGGLLDTVDDALDILGHAKNSKWGKRAGGWIGKGAGGIAKAGKSILGKGLGLLGVGAGAAGAAGVASAEIGSAGAAAAGAGGRVAAGAGGKIAGKVGARAIPVIGQALAVGMAAYDGYQGWTDKDLHKCRRPPQ